MASETERLAERQDFSRATSLCRSTAHSRPRSDSHGFGPCSAYRTPPSHCGFGPRWRRPTSCCGLDADSERVVILVRYFIFSQNRSVGNRGRRRRWRATPRGFTGRDPMVHFTAKIRKFVLSVLVILVVAQR